MRNILLILSVFFMSFSAQSAGKGDRIEVESPWFYVGENDVGLHQSISGFDPSKGERVSNLTIGRKALEMIEAADERIISSVFLFDNMYSDREPQWDIVETITAAIERKKASNPDIKITMIFGPLQRSYAQRLAPKVERLLRAGVDVFYSDLLTTKAHTPIKFFEASHHLFRFASELSFGILGRGLKGITYRIPIPFAPDVDGEKANLQLAFNAALIKANHRKILVTKSNGEWETLVSSANPHNASIPSTNYATSVKGALGAYVYDVLRSDVVQSLKLGSKDYVLWNDQATRHYKKNFLEETLPKIDRQGLDQGNKNLGVKAKFVSENKVEKEAVRILNNVSPWDRVRIQMFYLSDFDMVKAILTAASRVNHPVELLLDPNKDAFNKIKDGTPNRQVAAFLMENLSFEEMEKLEKHFPLYVQDGKLKDVNLVVRWYNTTGEQNHAKIMSVTDPGAGKYVLFNGSSNWTGKNLNGINMEANIVTDGAQQSTQKFNRIFDRLFTNSDGVIYSLDYDHEVYSQHAGIKKWIRGEKLGFVAW